MKKIVKGILWGVLIAAALAVLLHSWYSGWSIGNLIQESEREIPRRWLIGRNWRALPVYGEYGVWSLAECRVGSAGECWLFAEHGRADLEKGILYLTEVRFDFTRLDRLGLWLKEMPLPVKTLKGDWVSAEGRGTFEADRESGLWQLRRGGELFQFDGEFLLHEGLAETLPPAVAERVAACPVAVRFAPGPMRFSSRTALADRALKTAEVSAGAEYQWEQGLWRLTERNTALAEIPELEFARLTRSGSDAGNHIVLAGEVARLHDGELELWTGSEVPAQAQFSGSLTGGRAEWRLAVVSSNATIDYPAWSAGLAGWTVARTAAGMTREIHLDGLRLKRAGAPLSAGDVSLRFQEDHQWRFSAPEAVIALEYAGWPALRLEGAEGVMSLAGWRVTAARAGAALAEPEIELRIASGMSITPEGWEAQGVGLFGTDWQITAAEARGGTTVELAGVAAELPGGRKGRAPKASVAAGPQDGLTFRAEGWRWQGGDFSLESEEALNASGSWNGVFWRGELQLKNAAFEAARWGLSGRADLTLPVEFPDPGWRPSPLAEPDDQGFYRPRETLPPARLEHAALDYRRLRLGMAGGELADGGRGDWEGRLALEGLDGAEILWRRTGEQWHWFLPPAEWRPELQPNLYFPDWSGIVLTGTAGLEYDGESGFEILLRDAEVAAGGMAVAGLNGDWPLAELSRPESRGEALLTYRAFGPWRDGGMSWRMGAAGGMTFAALSGGWAGGRAELLEPVASDPESSAPAVFRMRLSGIAAARFFRWCRLPEEPGFERLLLDGEGEWWFVPGRGWELSSLRLAADDAGTLAMEALAGAVRVRGISEAFIRDFLAGFVCRRIEFLLLPGAGGGGLLSVGVSGRPAETLPYMFTGIAAEPWAEARPDEPGFSGEISFSVNLKIPAERGILTD